jgi:hypothetical protein
MGDKKIKALIVIEMLGRPVEHLTEVMNKFIDKIKEEKGVSIANKNIHKPKIVEKDKENEKQTATGELFTMFSEIELETEHIMDLIRVIFKYMPSHVEIISPEDFSMSNTDFNSILNEIIAMLHNYDSVAKGAIMKNQVLENQLNILLQNQKQRQAPNINITTNKKENKIRKKKKVKS